MVMMMMMAPVVEELMMMTHLKAERAERSVVDK